MAQARRYHTSYRKSKATGLATGGTLRQRRPKTKDALEKEKRIRLLDEAIVTGNIEALRKLSITGAGFVNDGIRRRAWLVPVTQQTEILTAGYWRLTAVLSLFQGLCS